MWWRPRRKRKDGAPKAFNVIVLGAAAKHMGFEKEDWLKVIETTVPPKTVEINKRHLRPVMRFLFRRTEAGK